MEKGRMCEILVDKIIDGILLADTKSKKFFFANNMICRMTGYSREEIMDLGVKDIHPGKDLPHVKEQFEKQVKGEFTLAKDIPVKRKDGSIFYADVNSAPVDIEGKTYLLGIFRDATDRRETEETLARSEEKWRLLVENAPNIIMILDREGAIEFINRTVPGLKVKDVIGKKHYEYIEPECRDMARETIERVFQTGKIGAYEIEGTGPKGKRSWYETRIGPIKRHGQVVSVMLITLDITERRKAELALRESEEKFRNLVERANDGICILQDGVFKYINKRVADMIGYPEDKIIDSPFKNYIHKNEVEKVVDRYNRRMAGEEIPSLYETTLAHRDGRDVYVEINAGVIPFRGKDADFVIVHDITGRKKGEMVLMEQKDLLDRINQDLKWKIQELEAALSHIKALEGLIPICVNCKKIHLEGMDPKDTRSWVSLEKYIEDKTDASLTHGLCPDCVKKMYGEAGKPKSRKKKKE